MGIKTTWIVIALFLTGLVGWLDLATGYEISFSIFYLIPISLAAWKSGRFGGVLISVASAACWFQVERVLRSPTLLGWLAAQLPMLTPQVRLGPAYSNPFTPYWNASVRLVFFVIITFLFPVRREGAQGKRKLPRDS